MIDPKPGEKRNSQDENSINQAPMAAGVEQPHNFRASMLRFWLEAIDNGDNSRLDYYLSNVLAFNVISRIIEQALEGGMDSKALAQAKKFSRMSGVEQIVGKFRENAPSCFEFIMLYATMLKVDGLDKLLQKTRRYGNVDVKLVCNCFGGLNRDFLLDAWAKIFSVPPLLTMKHVRQRMHHDIRHSW